MYKTFLKDKYDGTPLRRPPADEYEAEPKTNEPSRDGEPTTSENAREDVEATTLTESTQVQAFRKSIQKCRENCVSPPNTEELIERHSGTNNDPPEEEQPIRTSILRITITF